MTLKQELEGKPLGDLLTDDVIFLDKKDWDADTVEDIMSDFHTKILRVDEEIRVEGTPFTFLVCNSDDVLIFESGKLREIFTIYDLEAIWYDEDIKSLIGVGHETHHLYILPSRKYKVAYTR